MRRDGGCENVCREEERKEERRERCEDKRHNERHKAKQRKYNRRENNHYEEARQGEPQGGTQEGAPRALWGRRAVVPDFKPCCCARCIGQPRRCQCSRLHKDEEGVRACRGVVHALCRSNQLSIDVDVGAARANAKMPCIWAAAIARTLAGVPCTRAGNARLGRGR